LNREEWNDALSQASFNGIEFASYDYDGPLPRTSVMISKAIDAKTNGHSLTLRPHEVCILNGDTSPLSATLVTDLSAAFQASGFNCSVKGWDSLQATPTSSERIVYVVLDCLERPLLLDPSATMFENIRSLLTTPDIDVCWVSYQECADAQVTAMKGLATGIARSVRRENEGMRFITLDIQDAMTPINHSIVTGSVTRVVSACLCPQSDADRVEDMEFSLRHGRLMVPRLHTDTEFNHWADRLNNEDGVELTPFQGEEPLKLEVKIPGLLSSVCFTHDPLPTLPLGDNEIQVEAKAFGVNFRDVFIVLGQMPPTRPMAGEVAGFVTAVGSGAFVQNTFKVGDRVIGLLGPAYSSYTRMKGVHCQKLPESVGLVEGASIYTVFLTAYYGLIEVARLEKGQTILVHSASGGVGQAAIQIAHHAGAEIYATVGSAEKRRFLVTQCGIPESHILSSRSSPRSIKNKIMKLTGNRGVNVVINSMAGEMLAESWECLAALGVHIELGKADIYRKNSLNMAPFDRNLTFAAIDLTVLLETIPQKMFRLLGKILQLFDEGIFSPVKPLNVLPLEQIESAFRLIAERKHMGKVILDVAPGTKVNALLRPPTPLKLAADGTYLVAGGLGDLGRRITRLLAGYGAGHIVTLSRRTLDKDALRDLESEIKQFGGQLHVLKCDITDQQSVNNVKDYCRTLPPVRGIIHGGMVLRDRPLANMELDDWKTALRPKVIGTINLDNAFSSSDLDFFIVLTSISGVAGRLAQSNYAAGNNFQDAYMHERNGKTNTRYFAISVGAVAGSQSITSMTASRAQKELLDQASMSFTELFQMLQYAMDLGNSPICAQSAMGFDRETLLNQDPHASANPFFSMLPYLESAGIVNKHGPVSARDVGTALRNATSMDEAVEVISQAIGEKLVAFINRDIEDISFKQRLSSFGIDSLISIELKNWMMRTFGVSLQASELNGPASILELSRTLAGRSSILSQEIRSNPAQEEKTEQQAGKANVEPLGRGDKRDTGHGYECCKHFDVLPRQPIPDFNQTMKEVLENAVHFAADDEEAESLEAAIAELTAEGGVGRRIYERLANEAADPNVENWSSDYLLKAIHLSWRQGLAYSSFLLVQHEPKISHSQAERAAIIAKAACDYKEGLDKGEVLGKWMMGIPQCNHLQEWLFNSVREPAVGCDVSRKYSGDNLAVLRRGRLFCVPLRRNGVRLSFDELKEAMESILAVAQEDGPGAGILTADNRDSWAKVSLSVAPFYPFSGLRII
jgi:NADPH:quinone reductase-like Zn-dependent oxidoreductase/NADP-dependent 3-hydroxy acid dehydrogenase YdfG